MQIPAGGCRHHRQAAAQRAGAGRAAARRGHRQRGWRPAGGARRRLRTPAARRGDQLDREGGGGAGGTRRRGPGPAGGRRGRRCRTELGARPDPAGASHAGVARRGQRRTARPRPYENSFCNIYNRNGSINIYEVHSFKNEDEENIDDIMELFNTMIAESRNVNNTLIENQKQTENVLNKVSEIWASHQENLTVVLKNEIASLNNNTISKQEELIGEFKKLENVLHF